jgi:hypothetical protein
MIIENIFCNTVMGVDFKERLPWIGKYKRVWLPFLIFLSTMMYGWDVALALTLGFMIWRYPGWGEMFLAMHGDKQAYDDRERYFITWIADKIYIPLNTSGRKVYGMIWGALRGLYDAPTFVALSVLLNPYIALLALLMSIQGVVYHLVGRFIAEDTLLAEIAMGAYRGILLTIALLMGGFL